MSKKIIATLLLSISLSTTAVYADYVDNSNRAHADESNDIISMSFVSKGNTVVIYLDNPTGINYELGSELDNYSIPFVKVKSVELEKRKLDDSQKNEVQSDYYNKITLKTTSSIHEKQRFVVINKFENGSENPETEENLLHSIAPRGEVKQPKITKVASTSSSDSKAEVETSSDLQPKASYDHIASCIAIDSEHVRIDFNDNVQLDKDAVENILSYHLSTSSNGEKLEVIRAYRTKENQVILQTESQKVSERYIVKADWIEVEKETEWYFYSSNVSSN